MIEIKDWTIKRYSVNHNGCKLELEVYCSDEENPFNVLKRIENSLSNELSVTKDDSHIKYIDHPYAGVVTLTNK